MRNPGGERAGRAAAVTREGKGGKRGLDRPFGAVRVTRYYSLLISSPRGGIGPSPLPPRKYPWQSLEPVLVLPVVRAGRSPLLFCPAPPPFVGGGEGSEDWRRPSSVFGRRLCRFTLVQRFHFPNSFVVSTLGRMRAFPGVGAWWRALCARGWNPSSPIRAQPRPSSTRALSAPQLPPKAPLAAPDPPRPLPRPAFPFAGGQRRSAFRGGVAVLAWSGGNAGA